jgi:hypothetical protein
VIFTAEQCRQILEGRKTQARQTARAKITLNGTTVELTLDLPFEQQLRYTAVRVGAIVPIERPAARSEMTAEELAAAESGRQRPRVTVAEAAVTGLRLEQLGDIDHKGARAEGFRTTVDFKTAWVHTHERGWFAAKPTVERPPEQVAKLISRPAQSPTASAATLACQATSCDAELLVFDRRHAHRLVWVVALDVVESARLLARNISRGDYTNDPHRAMLGSLDAGEAIPAGVQEAYSRIARERDRTSGADSINQTVATLRVELANLRAVDHGVGLVAHRQISREIGRIERALDTLVRKLSERVLS